MQKKKRNPGFRWPGRASREREDRTIGSFSLQSGITREQLSLPLASRLPLLQAFVASYGSSRVSTSGLSAGHLMTTMKYSDRHLAGLSARPPDRVELIGAGSLGYGTGPSFG